MEDRVYFSSVQNPPPSPKVKNHKACAVTRCFLTRNSYGNYNRVVLLYSRCYFIENLAKDNRFREV